MSQHVYCYRNLHASKWSIRALSGPLAGKVIAHADAVMLSDVTFLVSEAGRQRVIREGRKNVHAGVHGVLDGTAGTTLRYDLNDCLDSGLRGLEWILPRTTAPALWTPVRYNPYEGPHFVKTDTGERVLGSYGAFLDANGKAHAA